MSLKSKVTWLTDWLTQWVTRSPIELSWTAKKYTTSKKVHHRRLWRLWQIWAMCKTTAAPLFLHNHFHLCWWRLCMERSELALPIIHYPQYQLSILSIIHYPHHQLSIIHIIHYLLSTLSIIHYPHCHLCCWRLWMERTDPASAAFQSPPHLGSDTC